MAFKTKTKTRILVEERQTLDAKHNTMLQKFNEDKTHIPEYEKELYNISIQLSNLYSKNNKSNIFDINLQNEIWKLEDRKKILENHIFEIRNNIPENEYMLKTGKILSNYYKILDNEKKIASNDNITHSTTKNNNFNNKNNCDKNNSDKNNSDKNNSDKNNSDKNNCDKNNSDKNNSDKNNCDKNNSDKNNSDKNNSDKNKNENENDINISNYDILPLELKNNNDNINNTDKKKSIFDWFYQNESNIPVFVNVDTGVKHVNITKKNISVSKFKNDVNIIENQKQKKNILENKDTIYEKYMKLIDKNYISINVDNVATFDTCPKCIVEMLLNNNTGILMCPKCGIMQNIIVDSDKPSFKEPPKEMTSFCYKRINHLNEFLAQFQAKETTDIPEDVYNEILMEIKKERIKNMALITPEKMRSLLKKIKKNDYYEHIPYIINQLNGLPAPVIAPEIEDIIRGMFKAIQIPFEKYCPAKRKNFLSYSYIMYKFFELLELDEYLQCFQLLKSRTKLHQQDLIWKNICKDLNWQFIKSL
jgi:hypothetical protein